MNLSNEELIAVMSKVREGSLTIEQALAEVQAAQEKLAASRKLLPRMKLFHNLIRHNPMTVENCVLRDLVLGLVVFS